MRPENCIRALIRQEVEKGNARPHTRRPEVAGDEAVVIQHKVSFQSPVLAGEENRTEDNLALPGLRPKPRSSTL